MTRDWMAPVSRWLALAAAQALFLWMFLSVASIESLGRAMHGGVETETRATAQRILQFVADWKHGLSGNSPIYMPGFFALAIAGWYWTQDQPWHRLIVEGALALALGGAVAWLAVPLGSAAAVERFAREFPLVAILPAPPMWHAALFGVFTAACWMFFVTASRKALVRRSFRPLALVPLPYVGLVLTRPWALDSLLTQWGTRVIHGDLVAIGSLLAIPVLTTIFVKTAGRASAHPPSGAGHACS